MGIHNVRTHSIRWPEDGSLEPKHVDTYVLMSMLMSMYVSCLTE